MAGDDRSSWFAAAVLALIVVLIGVAVWGLLEARTGGDDEDSIVAQLETYTACLADNGANLPEIEARTDGGFAVVVPGALLEGDVGDLRGAWQACRDAEPAFFAGLFSGGALDQLPDLSQLCEVIPEDFALGDMHDGLTELCEELGG